MTFKIKHLIKLVTIGIIFFSCSPDEYAAFDDSVVEYITMSDSLVYKYGGFSDGGDEPVSDVGYIDIYEVPEMGFTSKNPVNKLKSRKEDRHIIFKPILTGETRIMFYTKTEHHYGLFGPQNSHSYRTRYVVITE
jgi:hypothetical protein